MLYSFFNIILWFFKKSLKIIISMFSLKIYISKFNFKIELEFLLNEIIYVSFRLQEYEILYLTYTLNYI